MGQLSTLEVLCQKCIHNRSPLGKDLFAYNFVKTSTVKVNTFFSCLIIIFVTIKHNPHLQVEYPPNSFKQARIREGGSGGSASDRSFTGKTYATLC
jgi:hypothetical protein